MTEAMPFLQKYDITFLRPPTIAAVLSFCVSGCAVHGLRLSGSGGRLQSQRSRRSDWSEWDEPFTKCISG